jgi:hypothetical protein
LLNLTTPAFSLSSGSPSASPHFSVNQGKGRFDDFLDSGDAAQAAAPHLPPTSRSSCSIITFHSFEIKPIGGCLPVQVRKNKYRNRHFHSPTQQQCVILEETRVLLDLLLAPYLVGVEYIAGAAEDQLELFITQVGLLEPRMHARGEQWSLQLVGDH